MSRRERLEMDLSSIRKILIIRLRRMGDNIMTTPVITALKKGCPQASLTYVVEQPFREIVEGNPYLSRIIVLPRKQKSRDLIKSIKQIRKTKYDVLIDLFGGPKAAWITLFTKARLKIGYAVRYKSFIYDRRISRSSKKGPIHSVENHINLVRALGIEVNPIPPLLVPEASGEEKEKISDFIEKNNLNRFKIIVFHIGAGSMFRDWGKDNMVELIKMLSQGQKTRIILVGSTEDQKRAEQVVKESGVQLFSLAGRLGLKELRELIKRSDLFVGPDSGPMHLAASTETPIVAYFGPTLPARFKPWKANAFIIEKDYECRFSCRQKKCVYDDFRCIKTITPKEVTKACLEFL